MSSYTKIDDGSRRRGRSFSIPQKARDFWIKRLHNLGVQSSTKTRFDADAIVVTDPDGIELALVAASTNQPWIPWRDGPIDEDHAIRGFHSVTMTVAEASATSDLLANTMGFRKAGQDGRHMRFETGKGGSHSILDVIESREGPVGEESIGTVHHVA